MNRRQPGACDARRRGPGPSSVDARRSGSQQRKRELLLKADAFREHAQPGLCDGRLLLKDHAGELFAITGTDPRARQGHARQSMRDHLGCRKSEFSELDGSGGIAGLSLRLHDHRSTLARTLSSDLAGERALVQVSCLYSAEIVAM